MTAIRISYLLLLLVGLTLAAGQENSVGGNSTGNSEEGIPPQPPYPVAASFNVSVPMVIVATGTSMPNATYYEGKNGTYINGTEYLSGTTALDATVGGKALN